MNLPINQVLAIRSNQPKLARTTDFNQLEHWEVNLSSQLRPILNLPTSRPRAIT